MKLKFTLSVFFLMTFTLARGQGTAFTYQGRLNDGGNPAHGSYDFRFKLFLDPDGNTQAGSTILTNGNSISNGLIQTTLDFGPGFFNGSNYWLEVDVRTNGGSGYGNLTPLQPLLPTPYAIFANTASNLSGTLPAAQLSGSIVSANLSGAYGNPVTLNNLANQFSGSFMGNGVNVSNVNALALGGLNATNFWRLGGNNVAAGQFLGSTNNQAMEIWVNGGRGLRLEPIASDPSAPNVIGGSPINFVSTGVSGATIGGGGTTNYFGFPYTNSVIGNLGTVGGGLGNTAATLGTVGGGYFNLASSYGAVVGGGEFNTANGGGSFVGGGVNFIGGNGNLASGEDAVITGGQDNTASGDVATVGGGQFNLATNFAATVPGGDSNVAGASYSFAAGQQAHATNTGAFVWADSQSLVFSSTVNDSFNVRAKGGVRLVTGGAGVSVDGQPVLTTGSAALGFSIQPNALGAPNVIEGASVNFVAGGVVGATIGGGGVSISGGSNSVTGEYGTVGGGRGNAAGGVLAEEATIGGGYFNTASGDDSTVAGGAFNMATNFAATIGGGYQNIAGNYSVVPGGQFNTASGTLSFAAGHQAKAVNTGAFVWADSQAVDFSSTTNDQFLIRAQGGVGINTNNPNGASLYVKGNRTNGWPDSVGFFENSNNTTNAAPALRVFVDAGARTPDGALSVSANVTATTPNSLIAEFGNSSAFVMVITNDGTIYTSGDVFARGVKLTSDRNAKDNFAALDTRQVLEKVLSLPITQWNYKNDLADTKHIGPVAQDFHAAFGLGGNDDKHISVVDEGGVALAAVQGLNQKVDELKKEVTHRDAENAELRARLDKLEHVLNMAVAVQRK